jgi:hypothetical protein
MPMSKPIVPTRPAAGNGRAGAGHAYEPAGADPDAFGPADPSGPGSPVGDAGDAPDGWDPGRNATDAPDPFDPASLRLSGEVAAGLGVKKALLTVPVRKPDKSWFVRVHADPNYALETAVIELKEDGET